MAAGVIVSAAVATVVINWPGHFTYDSVTQLAEGRTGVYEGQHPPVMSWLLGVADMLRHGGSPFVIFDVALVDGALLALVLLGRPGSWLAPALAAAAAFLPQLAIYPAIVWKDVLFAGAACAGFATLAWAARVWTRAQVRWALIVASVGLLTLAALARQNGAVVWPFAAAVIGWLAARSLGAWRGVGAGVAFILAGTLLTVSATAALNTRVEDPHIVASLFLDMETYDLTAAVAREPSHRLDVLQARDPRIAAFIRRQGVAAYSPERIDSIVPVLNQIVTLPDAGPAVTAQWRELVLGDPLLYLRVRASAFDWVFLTPKPLDCVLIETGVDGPPDEMADAGLAERETRRDRDLSDYALGFGGTPVYSHAAFAIVGLVLLTCAAVRRRPEDIVVAGMLLAAFAFVASFALISIACDYRYLYFLDLAVIAATLYAAASSGPGGAHTKKEAR